MKKLATVILLGAMACTFFTSCDKKATVEIITEEDVSVIIVEPASKTNPQPIITTEATTETTTETTTAETTTAETTNAVTTTKRQEATTKKQTPVVAETTTKKKTTSQSSFSASSVAANAGNVSLKPGTKYTKSAFGTPISTTQAPSCHFDGMDNIYTYSGYTLYTYTNGNSQIIYTVEITSPSIKTAAGIGVGDSLDKVLSAYGTNYTSLNDYAVEYTAGGKTMFISLENNKVSMIELSV